MDDLIRREDAVPMEKWQELKETVLELRDNGGMASAQSSLYRAIKAMHADNILCKSTGGNLYLINNLLIEDSVKL